MRNRLCYAPFPLMNNDHLQRQAQANHGNIETKAVSRSVILEKLEGKCQYCGAPQEPTRTETVTLCLNHATRLDLPLAASSAAGSGALVQWRTTNQSWFQRGPDIPLVAASPSSSSSSSSRAGARSCEYTVTVEVERDSIVTVSTVTNATHGTFERCDNHHFCDTILHRPFGN